MGTTSNRFDLLRLVFATLVFVFHAVALSGADPAGQLEQQFSVLAELSIQGFFIVSGALVYGSWERSHGLADYAAKRFRRLYPAYAVVIFIPAIVSLLLNFSDPSVYRGIAEYLGANLIFLNFLQPELTSFFQGQRFTEVNGALWTLKIEVMFYLCLPLLAWILARSGRLWWVTLGVLVMGAFAWREGVMTIDHPMSAEMARQLPGQMMYFGAGMAIWRLWDRVQSHPRTLFAIGAAVLALSLTVPGLESLRVLGMAGIVIGVAFMPGPALNAARWGDVSYGIYIVHFPIVQSLVALGLFDQFGMVGGLALSTALVFGVSYLLWWWVEKPALRQDSHYRAISRTEGQHERVRNNNSGRDPGRHRYSDAQSTGTP